ncbi:MAG TPA: O-antigen ligase family protein [Gammaproteobacteria bacterium]
MERFVNILFVLLMAAFVLEFSLGVRISNIPGLSLKNIVLYGLIVSLFVVNMMRNKPVIAPNAVNVPIVLFIVYCLFSMLATALMKVVPNYSILPQLIFIKTYMDPFVLFVLAYSILHDEESIKKLLFSMVVLLVVFLAITALSAFDIVSVERATVDEKWGRSKGAFAEPNQFAAYLAAFVPLVLAFIFTSTKKVKKIIYTIVLVLTIFVLLLTGSRGGLVSLAASIGVYYVLHSKQPIMKSIFNLVGVYSVAFVGLVLIFFLLPENTASGLMLKISGEFVENSNTDYTSGRLSIWTRALEAFIYSPIFGTGWQTFIPLFGANSHSDYILFLVTTGVVGLGLFLSIFYAMFKEVMKWRSKDDCYSHFYNSYIGGLAAFMVSMLFVNIYNPTYFIMLYSALILRLGVLAAGRANNDKSDRPDKYDEKAENLIIDTNTRYKSVELK